MAVRAVVVTAPDKPAHYAVRFASWTGLLNGDTGEALEEASRADRSVQVEGIFGAGGNCRIEGRNPGQAEFRVLTDAKGNALDIQAPGLYQVTEIVSEMRQRVTAGDGATDLTVSVTARGARA